MIKSSYRWRKVPINLRIARYLARAAFHPYLRLFQSQTNTKHKGRITAWSSAVIFYLRIKSLFEGTEIVHVNAKRVETGSGKPGQIGFLAVLLCLNHFTLLILQAQL